jgi:aspartate-semialdehyde dehydrogenase
MRDVVLTATDPAAVAAAAPKFVFSALPNESAQIAEPAFARAGAVVFSNASFHRMHTDVPLVGLFLPDVTLRGTVTMQREPP